MTRIFGMDKLTLPALYYSSDSSSRSLQSTYFYALCLNIGGLSAASVLSFFNHPSWIAALIQATLLLLTLCSSIYIALNRPLRRWYAARALAESVKTMAWRYACRAEPFDNDDAQSKVLFVERIRELATQNSSVSGTPVPASTSAQISADMTDVRGMSPDERLRIYINLRVEDQLRWYTEKSASNETAARRLFLIILLLNALAVALAISRVHFFTAENWPTDVFVTLSACALTWFQSKKFGELSASYALAAHEISSLRDLAPSDGSEDALSKYIASAESAFSREHTQWVARQDH